VRIKVPGSIVLWPRAISILALLMLAGCAINPHTLCGPYVPKEWRYLGHDEPLATLLAPVLPHAPYTTNKGKWVLSVQHVWYQGGDSQLLACTLARRARDDCSVRTTAFQLIDGAWHKVDEDQVLCNVLAATP
jgi:hypothetical protein